MKRINQYAIISIKELNRAITTYREELGIKKEIQRSRKINLTIENYHFDREKQLIESSTKYDDYEPIDGENIDII